MNKPITDTSKQVPVIIDGKEVGTIPLATEYRILLQGMILGAEADLAHTKARLAELDKMFELTEKDS